MKKQQYDILKKCSDLSNMTEWNEWRKNNPNEIINLEDAHLVGAYLEDAHLEGAHLEGAYLVGAHLVGAHLEGAYLVGAHLVGAHLEGAYLEGAHLVGAYLEDAHLEGAHLDFSCWPLWYGSIGVNIDKKIFCQIAMHLFKTNCDDPEVKKFKKLKSFKSLVNQCHRINDTGGEV